MPRRSAASWTTWLLAFFTAVTKNCLSRAVWSKGPPPPRPLSSVTRRQCGDGLVCHVYACWCVMCMRIRVRARVRANHFQSKKSSSDNHQSVYIICMFESIKTFTCYQISLDHQLQPRTSHDLQPHHRVRRTTSSHTTAYVARPPTTPPRTSHDLQPHHRVRRTTSNHTTA